MTENDLRLLQAVFTAAREICDSDDYETRELERALDNFDLRATFQVKVTA